MAEISLQLQNLPISIAQPKRIIILVPLASVNHAAASAAAAVSPVTVSAGALSDSGDSADVRQLLLVQRHHATKLQHVTAVVDHIVETLGEDSDVVQKLLTAVTEREGTQCVPFRAPHICVAGRKLPSYVWVARAFRWSNATESQLSSCANCTVESNETCINPYHYRYEKTKRINAEPLDDSPSENQLESVDYAPCDQNAVFRSVLPDTDDPLPLDIEKQRGDKCWMPGCDVDLTYTSRDPHTRQSFEFPPRRSLLYEQWIAAGGATAVEPQATARVCHLHFRTADLRRVTRIVDGQEVARYTLAAKAVPVPQVCCWAENTPTADGVKFGSVRLTAHNVQVVRTEQGLITTSKAPGGDDMMEISEFFRDAALPKADLDLLVSNDKFFCVTCRKVTNEPCWAHAVHITDSLVPPLSRSSLPETLDFDKENTGDGVFARSTIHAHTVFGPFIAPLTPHRSSFVSGNVENFLQTGDDHSCNWMKHVRFAVSDEDQNLSVFLKGSDVYFVVRKPICPGQELKVAYSKEYADHVKSAYQKRILPDAFLPAATGDEIHDSHLDFTNYDVGDFDPMDCDSDDLNPSASHPADNEIVPEAKIAPTRPRRHRNDPKPKPKELKNVKIVSVFKHRCAECELHFRTQPLLDLHSAHHAAEEPTDIALRCVGCEYTAVDFVDLMQHVKQHGLKAGELVRKWPPRPCAVCGGKAANIRQHVQSYHPEFFRDMSSTWTQRCETCKEIFPTELSLDIHLKAVHQNMTNRQCRICKKVMDNWMETRDHVQSHRTPEGFLCRECGKTCDSYRKLCLHMTKSHTERTEKLKGKETPFFKLMQDFIEKQKEKGICYKQTATPPTWKRNYPCGLCPAVFPNAVIRRQHQPLHHPEDDHSQLDLGCTGCGQRSESFDALMQHLITHAIMPSADVPDQPASKNGACLTCGKKVKNPRLHAKMHHPAQYVQAYPVMCVICRERFRSETMLKCHLQGEHGEKLSSGFTCLFCEENFVREVQLHNHMHTHAEADGFPCPECDHKEPLLTALREHIATVHREAYACKCPVCGKSWTTQRKLRSHMVIHGNTYAYPCEQCGVPFKTPKERFRHVNVVHRGIKKKKKKYPWNKSYRRERYKNCAYKCETCLAGYQKRGAWVLHVRKKHPEIDISTLPP
ncbi:PR domain zinc finger protein 15-like [Paramacrobiotus metropolitanus]|uniref:PR domain zinc finger protein 15-like n=1 Tax=Paramacrobiotus metropolitanus TaxID=2943436 RepID=UPI002445EF9A|nr:PR domain zinc finger protein 15-like [Paramacrobiotus metropolitanus]